MTKLSRDEIERIVGRGRLSAHTLVELESSGATGEALAEALNRMERGGGVGKETLHPAGPVVQRLMAILGADTEAFQGVPDDRD